MNWSEVGKAVAKVAPVLGSVLGGPVGAICGAAGSLLASTLGVEPEPEKIMEKLKDNPDLLLKIKEIEAKNQKVILEWQAKQIEVDLENVKNARQREIELAKAGSKNAMATPIVALVVTVGFFILLWQVLGHKDVGEAGLLLLGNLGAGFSAVINYYLGSSLGSKTKDTIIHAGTRGK